MGISVQTSGIKVEQGKHYLVNLNADPSLNELLVYYLKVRCGLHCHFRHHHSYIVLSPMPAAGLYEYGLLVYLAGGRRKHTKPGLSLFC